MIILLVGLTLLTGDVLSQAHRIANSGTDSFESGEELQAVEETFLQLPFGARLSRLNGGGQFAYVANQRPPGNLGDPRQRVRHTEEGGRARNVIYLTNLNLPISKIQEHPTIPTRGKTGHLEEHKEIFQHLPPEASEYSPPNEIFAYLPPKVMPEYSPSKEVLEYLPPKVVPEYLPSKEVLEYLPPKVVPEYSPSKEVLEYLPPKVIPEYSPSKEVLEYLPPKETQYYLPPKEKVDLPQNYSPPCPAKVTGVITKLPDSSLSLFVKESILQSTNAAGKKYHESSEGSQEECKEDSIHEGYLVPDKDFSPKPLPVTSETSYLSYNNKNVVVGKTEPSSLLRPFALVENKIDEDIIPQRAQPHQLPYSVAEERITRPALPTYSPESLTTGTINQPIVAQSVQSNRPIIISEASGNRFFAPIKPAYVDHRCFSNHDCLEHEICDYGSCIEGCSLAKKLCIGEGRCETRHHIPACICPPMSIARTVASMQFDCVAMMMTAASSENAIYGAESQLAPNHVLPFTQTRPFVAPLRTPVVASPIRGTTSFIRDTALPPSISPAASGNPCSPSPCGPNTRCEINLNGIALCRCIDDYVPDGNTINGCKPQCITDSECPDDYKCVRQKCERVCVPGACGLNANCDARNHRAYCTCPAGFIGSPDSRCIRNIPVLDEPKDLPIDPCNPNPCGLEADCRARGERPVCSCPRGYEGDPLTRCIKGECLEHKDCPNHLACQNLRCIDPCVGVCGSSSECTVKDHQPICSCPRNFLGDPFVNCRAITEYDICNPSPCGLNTNCKVRHDRSGSMRAVCSCIDNYIGSPLTECKPECVRDTDCSSNQQCRENRCRNPCIDGCGEGSYCDARNHRAACTCPEFFSGDPHSRCYPECTKHEDCPGYQACYQFKCIDPCKGACGSGADCKVEAHTPICSCPRGYTGDPFVSCRAFTLDDLCAANPCGTNAKCHPGKDRSGNDRPVCVCPDGYIGNPLVSCQRGECQNHNECPDHQACYAYTCQSPCYTEKGSVCGTSSQCRVRDHTPVCSCPRGYTGNPLSECRIAPNARIAGHHRLQRRK